LPWTLHTTTQNIHFDDFNFTTQKTHWIVEHDGWELMVEPKTVRDMRPKPLQLRTPLPTKPHTTKPNRKAKQKMKTQPPQTLTAKQTTNYPPLLAALERLRASTPRRQNTTNTTNTTNAPGNSIDHWREND
jgi:hypothetical protein